MLSESCAASIIAGMQETDGVATIERFVANDQEHDRMAGNEVVSERALREIYLMPFQIAIQDSNPSAFMTAYPVS